ncbi:unnamed protein product [Polarella glacialis]|uniref:Uncharacterized protein n=1 Tax=Polarella glacialis TaxID=89957 RepID=A0A813K681_POLGL|nr:unnamed protein product [Polarella glacialis]
MLMSFVTTVTQLLTNFHRGTNPQSRFLKQTIRIHTTHIILTTMTNTAEHIISGKNSLNRIFLQAFSPKRLLKNGIIVVRRLLENLLAQLQKWILFAPQRLKLPTPL